MKACVLCGSKKYKNLFEVGVYRVVKCQRCGLAKIEGKQNVSYKDYHRDEEYQICTKCFKNIYQKRFNTVKRFKSRPGRVLDIGSSAGTMLQIFQKEGWETWGVEPSGVASQAPPEIKVLNTSIEKAKLPKNYFDVVILNHTLEHLQNPVSVLKKVKVVLKKRGIVYVDVPNFGSLDAQIWRDRWSYLLPEEHIHQFTTGTLIKVLEKAGLKVVWSKTWSGIFDYANPLLHLTQDLLDLRLNFIKDITSIPLNIVTTALNKGTSLAVVGEK